MKTTFYVTVNQRGSARLTKRMPDVVAGEVTARFTISIDDKAFRTPFADVNVEIPEGYVIKPEIEAWLEPLEEE